MSLVPTSRLRKLFARFLRDERGVMNEYLMLVAGGAVAVAAVVAPSLLQYAGTASRTFGRQVDILERGAGGGGGGGSSGGSGSGNGWNIDVNIGRGGVNVSGGVSGGNGNVGGSVNVGGGSGNVNVSVGNGGGSGGGSVSGNTNGGGYQTTNGSGQTTNGNGGGLLGNSTPIGAITLPGNGNGNGGVVVIGPDGDVSRRNVGGNRNGTP